MRGSRVGWNARQVVRFVRSVSAFALIGLLPTLAIAVLGSFFNGDLSTAVSIRALDDQGEVMSVGSVVKRWNSTRVGWSGEGVDMSRRYVIATSEWDDIPTRLPKWCTPADQRAAQVLARARLREATELGCGWPWRAFHARWEVSRGSLYAGTVVNMQHGFLGPGGGSQRVVIPYKPIWAGLIGDVVVLGAGAAGIVWFVKWNVRSVRRFRGRCEGCGYEVRGLAVCPECGRGA